MSKRQRRWFSLQITEGPNAGLGAGPWRLWVHRNDIYLAARGLENTIKVSLHESGKWRVGYTTEHIASDEPLWSRTVDRAAWKFDPPDFSDGVQEAFVVATVRAALRPTLLDGREAVVPVEDRWDRLHGVAVLVTEPGTELVTELEMGSGQGLVFSEPLELKNRRRVWLRAFSEAIEASEPEAVPAGQLVRVLTPEADGVRSPGYLVVGVNVA